jgi:hypothetical protein
VRLQDNVRLLDNLRLLDDMWLLDDLWLLNNLRLLLSCIKLLLVRLLWDYCAHTGCKLSKGKWDRRGNEG